MGTYLKCWFRVEGLIKGGLNREGGLVELFYGNPLWLANIKFN